MGVRGHWWRAIEQMDKDYLDMDSGWRRGIPTPDSGHSQLVRAMRQFKDYLEAGEGDTTRI